MYEAYLFPDSKNKWLNKQINKTVNIWGQVNTDELLRNYCIFKVR